MKFVRESKMLRTLTVALIAAGMLGGCASVQSAREDASGTAAIAKAQASSRQEARPVVEVHAKDAWLMGESIAPTREQPKILDKEVRFNEDISTWTINDYANWILNHVGVQANIDPSATSIGGNMSAALPAVALPALPKPSNTGLQGIPKFPADGDAALSAPAQVSMPTTSLPPQILAYNGDLKGFLDRVAMRYGIYWHYRNGVITLFKTETRTWAIPALPNASKSSGSISTSGSSGSGSGGGTAAVADSATTSSQGSGSSSGSGGTTSMSTSSSIDYWGALQKTAQGIAGPGVQVVVDKSFGTLSATGTPPQLDRLNEWVREMSSMLRKQVAIDVHVYNVQVNREDNYGLNLGLAYKSASGHTGVTLTSASIPTVTSTSTPMSFGANILGGTLNGTSVAVQALSTLGNVSQVVSRSGVTLNGQMMALQAARVQNYLASSQTTLTSTSGSSTALQPGSVTIGFTGTFLPRVVDGRIMIDLNMTLSDLLGITSASSGGSTIQLPDVQSTTFEQSIALKPGETLVLTGYRQHTASVTNNGVGSPDFAALGGGVDAQRGDTVMAVVISARLL